jgi:hypothetical protein
MASWLDTVFGGGAQKDAAAQNAIALQQYGGTATGALQQGYTTGTTDLTKAVGAYDPLAKLGAEYGPATGMYLNALGLGGPSGSATASAAFTNAPGYTQAVTAGTDAIRREMGAANMGNSGNEAEDVGTFVQNLQNQQYNTWLQNLASAGQTGAQITGAAAQGQAAGYGALGQLGYQYGSDQGSIAGNIASGTMADNNMVAAGEAAGAKNLLGAGLSLATLGMGGNPFGGSLTGGSGGGSSGGFGSSLIGSGFKSLANLGFGGGSPSGYGTG